LLLPPVGRADRRAPWKTTNVPTGRTDVARGAPAAILQGILVIGILFIVAIAGTMAFLLSGMVLALLLPYGMAVVSVAAKALFEERPITHRVSFVFPLRPGSAPQPAELRKAPAFRITTCADVCSAVVPPSTGCEMLPCDRSNETERQPPPRGRLALT